MLHSGAPRAPERAPGAQIPLGTVASKRQIRVGDVPIGGGAPVAVQSMTKTETADYEATMRQIHAVAEAGGDLVRCAVPRDEDVRALERENAVEALVAAAIEHVELMERLRFEDFKVSVKSTSVPNTIASNRLLAERIDYPLHLGITEAGTKWSGSLKSAVGLGTLLADGIGDTIRISLSTFHAEEEVKVAWEILKALKLRERGPVLIACPTCGRLQFDMDTVVGCAVNGIGEASHADFGITGAKNEGLIFAHGKPLRKVPQDRLVEELFAEIDKSLARGGVEADERKAAEAADWMEQI